LSQCWFRFADHCREERFPSFDGKGVCTTDPCLVHWLVGEVMSVGTM